MPLIRCEFGNPINGGVPPAPPAAAAAGLGIPAQGDHVFGDVLGALEVALQIIFGGGAMWQDRMLNYNATLHSLWNGLAGVDFGHSEAPVLARRAGAAERDRHAHLFGGFSLMLQYQMCEIACTNNYTFGDNQVRSIGGATSLWRKNVLSRIDDLIDNLVDETALISYVADPRVTRPANAETHHPTKSLEDARAYVEAHPAGLGRARVLAVIGNYDHLRGEVESLLRRFEGPVKKYNPMTDKWDPVPETS